MAKSKDSNQIVASDLQEAIGQLNFILARLSDRIDKLEGIRDSFRSRDDGQFDGSLQSGSFTVYDTDDTLLHEIGS